MPSFMSNAQEMWKKVAPQTCNFSCEQTYVQLIYGQLSDSYIKRSYVCKGIKYVILTDACYKLVYFFWLLFSEVFFVLFLNFLCLPFSKVPEIFSVLTIDLKSEICHILQNKGNNLSIYWIDSMKHCKTWISSDFLNSNISVLTVR